MCECAVIWWTITVAFQTQLPTSAWKSAFWGIHGKPEWWNKIGLFDKSFIQIQYFPALDGKTEEQKDSP